jgi:Secretion system C-terminal sorting domain
MKQIFTTITTLFMLSCAVSAQPVLCGGFGTSGMALVNGTTYTKSGTLGSGNFPFVSASKDGSKFYASSQSGKMYFIDVASSAFIDSMTISTRNLASSNEPDILFATTNAALVRINTTTKTVVDSVVLGVPWLPEERPNSKEVWVTDSGKIHVVDYSSSLAVTTFSVAASPYDYMGVRFSPGGTMAFKGAGTGKQLFKIDPATKAISLTVNTAPVVPGALVVSHDSSKVFVCDATNMKVMIYKSSDLSLQDSIVLDKVPMNIYRHPTRNEIWVVHHFSDSVSVFDENTKALIAAFGISGSPWYLAFGVGSPTSVQNTNRNVSGINVYPNPATGQITLIGIAKNDRVAIYDVSGKNVISWNSINEQLSFNISALKTGYYLAHVLDSDGNVKADVPFVKQ